MKRRARRLLAIIVLLPAVPVDLARLGCEALGGLCLSVADRLTVWRWPLIDLSDRIAGDDA